MNIISNLFTPQIGDKVKVIGNNNSHNYKIGNVYKVSIQQSVYGSCQLIDEESGWVGNNILYSDIESIQPLSKNLIIEELSSILEFLKDYEGDVTSNKIDKEFKVYRILKELKSAKSDFEKISLISKYF